MSRKLDWGWNSSTIELYNEDQFKYNHISQKYDKKNNK